MINPQTLHAKFAFTLDLEARWSIFSESRDDNSLLYISGKEIPVSSGSLTIINVFSDQLRVNQYYLIPCIADASVTSDV